MRSLFEKKTVKQTNPNHNPNNEKIQRQKTSSNTQSNGRKTMDMLGYVARTDNTSPCGIGGADRQEMITWLIFQKRLPLADWRGNGR